VRISRRILTGLGAFTLVVGAAGAVSGTADAAVSHPVVRVTVAPAPFTNDTAGEAGILISQDNHTHYRYVGSGTVAATVLSSLNDVTGSGASTVILDGAEGQELCDPNTGLVAQDGMFYDQSNGKWYVAYAYGVFNSTAVDDDTDVCASGGLLATITENGSSAPTLTNATPSVPAGDSPAGANRVYSDGIIPITVSNGNKVDTSVYFNANSRVKDKSIQFAVADTTTGWARTDTVPVNQGRRSVSPEFWETGAGAFTDNITTNAFDAISPINLSGVTVNYYSSDKPAYPIYTATPYYGTGGLVAVSATNGTATLTPVEVSTSSFNLTESEG